MYERRFFRLQRGFWSFCMLIAWRQVGGSAFPRFTSAGTASSFISRSSLMLCKGLYYQYRTIAGKGRDSLPDTLQNVALKPRSEQCSRSIASIQWKLVRPRYYLSSTRDARACVRPCSIYVACSLHLLWDTPVVLQKCMLAELASQKRRWKGVACKSR